MDKPNDRLVASPNNDILPAWTPDGQNVVFSETSADGTAPYSLWSIRYEDRGSRTAVRVPIEPLPVVDVSFSPDGYWMAFESWPDATANQDIYITTATGANRTRLTTDPGYDFDPVWRPNSQK
jgi:Tol biopolymer transport system component